VRHLLPSGLVPYVNQVMLTLRYPRLKKVRDSMKAGATDVKSIKSFLDFEIDTLSHLNEEIVEEALVQKGHLAEVCEEASKRRKTE
jgi:hypothetical protein